MANDSFTLGLSLTALISNARSVTSFLNDGPPYGHANRVESIAEGHAGVKTRRQVYVKHMPTLSISDGKGSLDKIAWVFILSAMSYPVDPEKYSQLVAVHKTNILLYKNPDQSLFSLPRHTLESLLKAPSKSEAFSRATKAAAFYGSIAGRTLMLAVAAHTTEGNALSVGKAQWFLSRAMFRQGESAGRATMMKAWSSFKSVSHLWAALTFWSEHLGSKLDGLTTEDYLYIDDDATCRRFLAIAEAFRRSGQRTVPASQARPLLAGTDMWRVPEDLQIAELDLPSLEVRPWVEAILSEYRADR